MGHDGRAVANFILDFCDKHNRKITHLSLQKVAYFCHVWSLVNFGKPLVKHKFEAWEFGPVLQYLYRQFKSFDRNPITGRATGMNAHSGKEEKIPYNFDKETEELLYRVVDFYSQLNPSHLVELSHAKGGPWDTAWNHDGKINPGMTIDNEAIAHYYSKIRSPALAQ